MPPSEAALASGWTLRDGLLVEARLSALGVRHGVTTRRLGDMKDPANRREAAVRVGLPEPMTLRQVHGERILAGAAENVGRDGDGWLVDKPGICVGVYAADCAPLFVWSDDGRAAGVFHAGWRGTAKGMAKAAVAAFAERLSIPASRLCAAIGPHIGPCCYRVGPEFEREFPAQSLRRRGGELYLDLGAENRRQLAEAGVDERRLGPTAACTACGRDDYFSFRRDKQDARMLAFLSLNR